MFTNANTALAAGATTVVVGVTAYIISSDSSSNPFHCDALQADWASLMPTRTRNETNMEATTQDDTSLNTASVGM